MGLWAKPRFPMMDIGPRLRRLPADTMAALAFFSRLPVAAPPVAFDLRESAGAWPIAGLVVAALSCVVLSLASVLGLPPLVAALCALATQSALTGGLHEDGLADTADALGGRSREARLAIMRDSRLGSYGALALVFTIGLKAAAITAMLDDPPAAALALLGAAALSRSFALWHWRSTDAARPDGLASAAGQPDELALAFGTAFGAISFVSMLMLFGSAAALGFILATTATVFVSRLATRHIGGHTGDTIGAAQQIAETLLLVGLSSLWAPVAA